MSLFPSSVDRLFARFCRRGDAAALGEVFDRTAPELLRVACFLVGQRADAEDLVQRTFLAAIEARSSFRSGVRALPWLLGILANHARQLQRERRRTPPPADERTIDPAIEAAQRELHERLVALRNELGVPYVDVVQLHLEQGLNAKEIAVRLQRPAGTVRTQLMRALAVLRQRLPDGFVAGGAFALLGRPSTAAGPALAAIRQVVVRAAGGAPATAAAVAPFAIGSLFVTKKFVAVVPLVLGLSLLGAWLAWPDGATIAAGPTPNAAAAASATLAAAPAANDAARGATDTGSAASARVAADATVLALAEPGFAALRVRVRFDGKPATGVGVFASNGRTAARRDAVTDNDGVADLPHLAPGAWSVSTTLGTGELTSDHPARCSLANGEVRELEITVVRLAEVHGRVVDAEGRPVAGARLWMSIDGDYFVGHEVGSSGADGTFRLPILGAHHIGARKAGYEPSHTIVANPLNVEAPIVLVLQHRGGVVRGTVTNRVGEPVAWAKVLVGDEYSRLLNSSTQPTREDRPRGIEVTTDRRGAFVADGVPLGLLEVRAVAAGFAPYCTELDVPAQGAAELRIVLAPGASVRGTVRDTAGAAIAGATVRCGAEYELAGQGVATDAAGAYVLEDLAPGEQRCTASRGGARATTTLALTAGTATPWDPVLGANLSLAGRVVGADGKGLAGYLVDASSETGDRGNATTDAEGRFVLADAGSEPVDLCVSKDMQVLRTEKGVKPGRDDVVITLTSQHLPSAFVVGRLVDEVGRPVESALVPWHADSGRAVNYRTDGKSGAFRIGPLRPGRYRIVAESPTHGRAQIGEFELAPDATRDLGACTLKLPGGVRFTVTIEGRPAPGGLLFLRRPDGSWSDTLTIEQGAAKHDALPPGLLYATAQFQAFTANVEVAIVQGAVAHASLDMQRPNRATVTLLDPRGRSREELDPTLYATHPDGAFAGMFGAVGLPGAPQFFAEMPPGRYLLRATVADGRSATGEVDLRAGHVKATLELPK